FTHTAGPNLQGQTLFTGTAECVPPTCLKPTNVLVSGIGMSVVDITWDENNTPPATQWHILVLPAAAPAPGPDATGWVLATSNPFQIDGLDPGTVYKVYVRSLCSDTDYSLWSQGVQFNTLVCLPENQCLYSFVMTDAFGDGWNGNTMTIYQGGVAVGTIG